MILLMNLTFINCKLCDTPKCNSITDNLENGNNILKYFIRKQKKIKEADIDLDTDEMI